MIVKSPKNNAYIDYIRIRKENPINFVVPLLANALRPEADARPAIQIAIRFISSRMSSRKFQISSRINKKKVHPSISIRFISFDKNENISIVLFYPRAYKKISKYNAWQHHAVYFIFFLT